MARRSTEIRHLQALAILAQELHFGRAAQRLSITQPALSQLIRDLEARLGFRLVERTTRRVMLTSAGRSLLADAEALLVGLEQAIDRARAEAGQASNSIRIGVILPVSFEFLPAVLSQFRRRYPNADVHIETSQSEKLLRRVEAGSLNVALLRPPKSRGSVQIETLHRETFVAAMRIEHPLAHVENLRLPELRDAKIVRIARGDLRDAFEEIDAQLEATGIDLGRSQPVETTLTALAMVCAGDGVSLVPSWASMLPWPGVCFREVRDLTARIELAIAWDNTQLSLIAEHFIDIARRYAAGRHAKAG